MTPLIKILAGVIPGLVLVFPAIILLFLWWRRCRRRPQQQQVTSANAAAAAAPLPSEDGIQAAIDKFHSKSVAGDKNILRFHHLHPHQSQSQSQKPNIQHQPPLNWGWSQFVFVDRSSVPRSSPLWSLCARGDVVSLQQSPTMKPGTTAESMQSVRISPARPKSSGSSGSSGSSPLHAATDSFATTSCTRMSLPLPGPSLIGASFPQEAYFEITVTRLNCASGPKERLKDGAANDGDDDDRLKLIEQNHRRVQFEGETDTRRPPTTEHGPDNSLICLGLTRGGSAETKLIPGTYPGSIGFRSNGSVCLDGIKLVSESNRTGWATVGRVIGCGFSPSKKKVFFTVDSELVHVIRCHSEAYKSPLYPILSANSEVTVQVNLGQAAFKYVPANAHRTDNPCFLPTTTPSYMSCQSVGGAYEDSREFFSIRMPDTECFDHAASAKSPGITTSIKKGSKSRHDGDADGVIADVDKDFDLFEIALNY
ncbi:uncharacterized protein M6B38_354825 [Iris pallida]|uniref:SPRY domain-containing protein n=1 Tax=Iris pallida TaxID=29817 RepID=A0AAX6GNI4_IRIPA|nr:uncharacterized protein M6B38_354825 [Iris pallida]